MRQQHSFQKCIDLQVPQKAKEVINLSEPDYRY